MTSSPVGLIDYFPLLGVIRRVLSSARRHHGLEGGIIPVIPTPGDAHAPGQVQGWRHPR